MWVFYYFNFEMNYDNLISKSPCILLNKNINLDKNETESKAESPRDSFRRTNFVLQRKFCPKEIFSTFVFYLNVYCIEYKCVYPNGHSIFNLKTKNEKGITCTQTIICFLS